MLMAGPAFALPNWAISLEDPGQDGSPAGSTIVYDLEIRNDAVNPADGAGATTVIFDVAAGTTMVDGGGLLNCVGLGVEGGQVTCDVPPIAASGALSFAPQVLTTVAGSPTLTATVPGTAATDSDVTNNSASQQTTLVAGADIALSVTGPSGGTAASGEFVDYVFTATNEGPNASGGFNFEFPIPSGLGSVTIDAPAGCVLTGSTYVCAIPGVVAVGDSVNITVTGQVTAGDGATVTPLGSVGGGTPADPVADNNVVTIDTGVTGGSDLSVGKTISTNDLLVGDPAVFTLTTAFTGDDPQGLLLTDVVPSQYTVVSVDENGSGWDCSASAGNAVSCSQSSGGSAGADVSLGAVLINVIANTSTSGSNVTNEATISASGTIDPNPDNNTANDGGVNIEDPFVDHQINKSGPAPAIVAVGSEYEFRLSSTNIGNAAFFGTLQIVDDLPAGMTLSSVGDAGWTCSPTVPPSIAGPAQLICEIIYTELDPLPAGATTPVILTGVIATTTGPLGNTATVSAPVANIDDVLNGNDTTTFAVDSEDGDTSPDVEILKTAALPTLLAGEIQTFVIEVANNGPITVGTPAVDAEGVVVSDTLRNLINNSVGAGGGVESIVVDAKTTDLSCTTATAGSNGVQLTCPISVLPECVIGSGDCPTITVQVRPGGEPSSRDNTATVITTITADSGPGNNASTAPYDVTAQTDVTVNKTATPDPAAVGQNLVYVITAQNQPNDGGAPAIPITLSAAQNVTITDTLPDDLTFVSITATGGGICSTTLVAGDTTAGDSISCNWATINNNGQQTAIITVRPNNETLNNAGPQIVNNVAITTDTPETNAGNNSASTPVDIIEPSFDLFLNKFDDVDPLAVGDTTTYLVELRNAGPSAAENVVVVDQMPASGLGFQSFTPPAGGSCVVTNTGTPAVNASFGNLGVELTCTVPYLAAGATATFEIEAIGDTKGSVTNTATISADDSNLYESNTANDMTTQATNVRTRVDVEVNSKIADRNPVNLGEDFNWVIEVENNAGVPGQFYGIADGVVLTDNLPAGMILTGMPTASNGTCSGALNDVTFTCDLGNAGGVAGSMAIGEIIQITVPVRVIAVTTDAESFTNTVSIEATNSFDNMPANNTGSGDVVVNTGSISGKIYRDFNDNAVTDAPGDTNVNVVLVTLSGTDLNGNTITRTITTTDGTYDFGLLPQGDYTVTRGPIGETYQTDGQNTAGTGGATYTGLTSPTIVLAGNEDAGDYDFAIVPQARIGLAKRVLTPPAITLNADGSFDVPFRFVIENFSLEALNAVVLDDPLSGPADLFGAYTTATTVAGGMARGSYTILVAPTNNCGGASTGFTGEGANTLMLTGGTIAAGGSCVVNVTLRVNPTDPLPTGTPEFFNSATVDGTGVLSGQTSATNPLLTDISDNDGNPDANGDGSGDDAGENDPTPVDPDLATTVILTKTVDVSAFADPLAPVAGELLTYTYTVNNPTAFNVFDINVVENAPGAQAANSPPNFSGTGTPPTVGAPTGGADIDGQGDLVDLAPFQSLTYTATYAITQADINAGFVLNTASLTATDVYGAPLSDFSDDPTVTNGEDYNADGISDDPTIAPLPRIARLEVDKSIVAESFSSPYLLAGDTIDYQFIVTNTGNTDISAVTPVDPGPQFGGFAATGAPLVFATSDVIDLGPTAFATFTATYTLTAADVDNYYTAASPTDAIANVADATGTPQPGTTLVTITDTTDTGADPAPAITLTKAITAVNDANGNGILGDSGDEIVYDLTVTNSGFTSLADVRVTDAEIGLSDAPLTSPTAGANLAAGDSGAIIGLSYVITPLNQAQGTVVNTATVAATAVATNTDGTPDAGTPLVDGTGAQLADVVDTSDTLTDPVDGAPAEFEATADPAADGDDTSTVLNLPVVAADITITKRIDNVADTNGNGVIGDAEDVITYTLLVTNTGTTALADVLVTDPILGLSQNVGGLAIGAASTISGLEYSITVQNQSDRIVVNTATASGDPVSTGPGNVPDAANPLVDGTGSDLPDVTDLSDTLTDPVLDPSTGLVGDVADPDAGGNFDDPTVVNLPATGPAITLTKAIAQVNDLNGNGQFGDAGDEVLYNFVVTNTGNTSLADVGITDVLLGLSNEPVAPLNLAPDQSGVLNGVSYIITGQDQAVGQIENTADTTGRPVATDAATGEPDPATALIDPATGVAYLPVVDTSDTRTNPNLAANGDVVVTADPNADANPDAPTLLNLPPVNPEITLRKEIVTVFDANNTGLFGDAGDTVQYSLTVENTGNTSLAGLTVTDVMLGLSDTPFSPAALIPGGTATLLVPTLYTITTVDQGLGQISNSAETTGTPVQTGPGNVPVPGSPMVDADGDALDDVADLSDTQTDPDLAANGDVIATADPAADNNPDAPTLLNLVTINSEITLVKSIVGVSNANNNNVLGDAGDVIEYLLTVSNTGNTALTNVTVSDTKLSLVDIAIPNVHLGIGESDNLPAQFYEITTVDQGNGAVVNTATAEGQPSATDPITGEPDPSAPLLDSTGAVVGTVDDTSDTLTDPDLDANGDVVVTADPDADGNPDAPTILNLPTTAPAITLVKSITEVRDINNNGLLGDVGDEVVYSLTVTNTGNAALAGVTISDVKLDLANVPVTPANLLENQSATLSGLVYVITPADQGAGALENTATTQGQPVQTDPVTDLPDPNTPLIDPDTGVAYEPVVDTSDTLTEPDLDANGDVVVTTDPDADGNPDAPTLLNLPDTDPVLTLIKSITAVRDINGNGLFGDAGDEVDYTLTVTNDGNTSLAAVTISDPKLSLVDVAVVPADLIPGASATLAGLVYVITPADQGVGVLANTATAAGLPVATDATGNPDPSTPLIDPATGVQYEPVTDTSDTQTDPDLDANGDPVTTADPAADGPDNPTLLNLPATEAEITLVKSITEVTDVNGNGLLGDVGDLVSYELVVTNTGNTSLAAVTISDLKLSLVDAPVVPADLIPGASATLLPAPYEITPADQAAGEVVNTAVASGTPVATDANGLPDASTPLLDGAGNPLPNVDDTSDTLTDPELDADGNPVATTDPDADGADTPTVLNLPAVEPGITLVKSVTSVTDTNADLVLGNVGDTINYSFVVTNSGNTALNNVTLSDPLLNLVAVATTPDVLSPGDFATLDGALVITTEMLAAGFVENTATASGNPIATGPDGLPDPATPLVGPDGNPLAPVTDISDTGSEPTADDDGTIVPITDPAGQGDGDDPTVIIIPLVPSPLFISGTVFLDVDRGGILDADDDPTAGANYTVNLIDADGNIVGTAITNADGTYIIEGFPTGVYTVEFLDPDGEVVGELGPFVFDIDNQSYTDVNFPIVLAANDGSFTLVKTASVDMVSVGQTVTYDITASNLSGTAFGPVTVTDTLPAGLAYTPDSTTVDGVAVTPSVSGQTISVSGLTLPANGSVVVSLQVRVLSSAPSGDITNVAGLTDGNTGIVIADPATAVIRRRLEAVFQCSDIIGKVFDDVDRDGYQDGLVDERAAITNQDIFVDKLGGKLTRAPAPVSRSEPGLPGVRLVTTDGTIITTDEYGRYNVPCAAIPAAIGANFTLKVDTNSLPTGYRLTTENPRTMRVTAGILTEMNFGASIGRVVDIDLTGSAFDADHRPTAELFNGLDGLLAQVKDTPSILRISYFTNGESASVANGRLNALESVIRDKWRNVGNYRLVIERTVTRLQ